MAEPKRRRVGALHGLLVALFLLSLTRGADWINAEETPGTAPLELFVGGELILAEPGPRPDRIVYRLLVRGVERESLSGEQLRRALQVDPGIEISSFDERLAFVGGAGFTVEIPVATGPRTFLVGLSLPDGRHAEVALVHWAGSAPKSIPPPLADGNAWPDSTDEDEPGNLRDLRLSQPQAIAVADDGTIYVTNAGQRRVDVLAPDGTLTRQLRGVTAGGMQPGGVAVGPDGLIYVTDAWQHRLLLFSRTGRLVGAWQLTTPMPPDEIFGHPDLSRQVDDGIYSQIGLRNVTRASDGTLYVADAFNHSIYKLAPTGDLLAKWGRHGSGPGEFDRPTMVAIDSEGNVYVTDIGNDRIQVFGPDGSFQRQIGDRFSVPYRFDHPNGIVIDRSGELLVSNSAYQTVNRLGIDGTAISSFGTPGRESGQFNYPLGLALDSSGKIYVADFNNHRIQVFTSDCAFVESFGGRPAANRPSASAGCVAAGTEPIERVPTPIVPVSAPPMFWMPAAVDGGTFELVIVGEVILNWPPTRSDRHSAYRILVRGVRLDSFPREAIGQLLKVDGPSQVSYSGRNLFTIQIPHDIVPQTFVISVTLSDGRSAEAYLPHWAGQTPSATPPPLGAGKEWPPSWDESNPPDSVARLEVPQAIAVADDGTIYIANTGVERVEVTAADGTLLRSISARSAGGMIPRGVAAGPNGLLYVSDSLFHRILLFSKQGRLVGAWQLTTPALPDEEGLRNITLDQAGNLYVADAGNQRIYKLSPNGQTLEDWGQKGSGDGMFEGPSMVAFDAAGNLYVTDTGNSRIQVLAPDGTYLRQFGTQGDGRGEFSFPGGIVTDSHGDLLIADTVNHRIQRVSTQGEPITRWGEQGAGEGEFEFPSGLALDSIDHVYVADYRNHRVQVFALDGEFLAEFGVPATRSAAREASSFVHNAASIAAWFLVLLVSACGATLCLLMLVGRSQRPAQAQPSAATLGGEDEYAAERADTASAGQPPSSGGADRGTKRLRPRTWLLGIATLALAALAVVSVFAVIGGVATLFDR